MKFIRTFSLIIIASVALLSCKKDNDGPRPELKVEILSVITNSPSGVTYNQATLSAVMEGDTSEPITLRGFGVGDTPIQDSTPGVMVSAGSGYGNFSVTMNTLQSGHTYHVRAFAVEGSTTYWGEDIVFTTTSAPVYTIGGSGPGGGIVFYDKGSYTDGWRYLEVSGSDIGVAPWGCSGITVNSFLASNTDPGTGLGNTINILNASTETGIAARICDQCTLGGFTDWYLPSLGELNAVHQNLFLNNIGNFTQPLYWSSNDWDTNLACAISFNAGFYVNPTPKSTPNSVRAVRRF